MFVHREALAAPVARTSQFLELVDDDSAVFLLPHPHALEELLAADVAFGFLFLLANLLFHHSFRGDAGVVGAREPEDFPAVHARLAAEDVLDGVVEDVAKGEDTGDVGWGDDDGISRALFRNARRVGTLRRDGFA